MSIFDKIKKITKNEYAFNLNEENLYEIGEYIDTGCYALNAVLSDGDIYKGIPDGKRIMLAGESGTAKSLFTSYIIKKYLDNKPNSKAIFFESEGSTTVEMARAIDIDENRMIILPVMTIEETRTQMVRILDEIIAEKNIIKEKNKSIKKDYDKDIKKAKKANILESDPTYPKKPVYEEIENFIFVLDSLGMLSSAKETEDVVTGSDKKDLTKSQLLRGFARVISLKLAISQSPFVVVNHTYSCLTKGHMIKMHDDSLKEISSIKKGEFVKTSNGKKEILSTHKFKAQKTIKFILEDNSEIRCTPNHKFMLTNGKWKRAEDINENDDLLINSEQNIMKIIKKDVIIDDVDVFDVEVADDHYYFLENGIFSHNTFDKYNPEKISGGCLVKDTKVTMSDNTIKNIQDIEIGDCVKTLSNSSDVIQKFHYKEKDCYELEFEDGLIIKATKEHKFLIDDGTKKIWKCVEDITEDDIFCCDSTNHIHKIFIMKLINKNFIGKQEVFDIEVARDHHYILENGLVSHNSGMRYMADIILILTKTKAKEENSKEQIGVEIRCKVDKSRYMRENKFVRLLLSFKKGLYKYSHLTTISSEIEIFKKEGFSYILPDGSKVKMKDMKKPALAKEHFNKEVLDGIRHAIKKDFEFGDD
jgi:intein/homing endonuclease